MDRQAPIKTLDDIEFRFLHRIRDLHHGPNDFEVTIFTTLSDSDSDVVDRFRMNRGSGATYRMEKDGSGRAELDREVEHLNRSISKVADRLPYVGCLAAASFVRDHDSGACARLIDRINTLGEEFWKSYSQKLERSTREDRRDAFRDLFFTLLDDSADRLERPDNKILTDRHRIERLRGLDNTFRMIREKLRGDEVAKSLTLGKIWSLIDQRAIVGKLHTDVPAGAREIEVVRQDIAAPHFCVGERVCVYRQAGDSDPRSDEEYCTVRSVADKEGNVVTLALDPVLEREHLAADTHVVSVNLSPAGMTLQEALGVVQEKISRDIESHGEPRFYHHESPAWGMPLDFDGFLRGSRMEDKDSKKAAWHGRVRVEERLLSHFVAYTGKFQYRLAASVLVSIFPDEYTDGIHEKTRVDTCVKALTTRKKAREKKRRERNR